MPPWITLHLNEVSYRPNQSRAGCIEWLLQYSRALSRPLDITFKGANSSSCNAETFFGRSITGLSPRQTRPPLELGRESPTFSVQRLRGPHQGCCQGA